MKKRILAVLLVLGLCFAAPPLSAFAAGSMSGSYNSGVVTVTGSGFDPGNYIIHISSGNSMIALGHATVSAGTFSLPITTGVLSNGSYQLTAYLWDGTRDSGGTFTVSSSYGGGGGGGGGPKPEDTEDPEDPKDPDEERLAGYTQMDTAIAISQKGWPEKADTVVVAYAYSFPDALAAAPLAYKENAPILLTDKQRITSSTLTEIQRLNPAKVIIVGGTGVITTDVENTLRETYQVVRYAGYTHHDTAVQIADAMGTTGKAVVVNGDVYQDALVISSYAANQTVPILFTERDTLPSVTASALSRLGVSQTIVTGGTGVVSAAVYGQLPGPSRYAGYDCYETAAIVATASALNMNLENVFVTTGIDFTDALVAGNLAARTLSPLIMVDGGTGLPQATENFFRTNKASIKEITVVGGTIIIPPSKIEMIKNLLK